MAVTSALSQRLLGRLKELIEEGEAICGTIKKIPGGSVANVSNLFTGEVYSTRKLPDRWEYDSERAVKWSTQAATVLSQIIPASHASYKLVEQFRDYTGQSVQEFRELRARLAAVHADFEYGLFDNLAMLVRAEVADDYLGQADMLLGTGYYIPAAVLAGAVLEDTLRKLCGIHNIDTTLPSGKRKTIDPMNTDLAKASAYNAAKAQEIRSWAAIRNNAAHGHADQVDAKAVERMVVGVRSFIGDFLR